MIWLGVVGVLVGLAARAGTCERRLPVRPGSQSILRVAHDTIVSQSNQMKPSMCMRGYGGLRFGSFGRRWLVLVRGKGGTRSTHRETQAGVREQVSHLQPIQISRTAPASVTVPR